MHYIPVAFAVFVAAFVAWRVLLHIRYHPTRVYLEMQEYLHPSSRYTGKKG